ncbi:MAG: hypothetical protein RBS17_03270 [Coriobacteriia bacterium]|nr:hypothetical protein [Coriobacteriia bacterium]
MSPTLKRIGIGAGVVGLVLAVVVVAMFAFGKPMTSRVDTVSMDSPADAASVSASDPLAVQIPGCVCHSDDPAVVEEHASYRMSDCFDCHSDGMPEMGR